VTVTAVFVVVFLLNTNVTEFPTPGAALSLMYKFDAVHEKGITVTTFDSTVSTSELLLVSKLQNGAMYCNVVPRLSLML
jgi:hypothetical protein